MDIEYLHLFVKNAATWRDWFVQTLNFRPLSSPAIAELGEYAVQNAQILILLSSEGSDAPEVSSFLQRYSEGIGDIAFRVNNLDEVVAQVEQTSGHFHSRIQSLRTLAGTLRWCRIQGWGSVTHTLIEGSELSTRRVASDEFSPDAHTPLPWLSIDHAVLNVPMGELKRAAAWYEDVLGFMPEQSFVIETPRSGLRSVVLKHPNGNATLPINEPTSPSSQIQEFLNLHRGPGIQHVALRTRNLIQTIAILRNRGVPFLSVPDTYYQQLQFRPGFWLGADDWEAIAQQQVLVDWPTDEPHMRLLQTFTQPLFEQPTFFWEFIERQPCLTAIGVKCAEGFGEGNFQALFEAIERQQQRRGSLDQ